MSLWRPLTAAVLALTFVASATPMGYAQEVDLLDLLEVRPEEAKSGEESIWESPWLLSGIAIGVVALLAAAVLLSSDSNARRSAMSPMTMP